MTLSQLKWFNTELWPRACRAQGWKPSDRDLKLRVVSNIIGRTITTTKDVGTGEEFDTLLAELRHLANPDNLAAALATVDGSPQREQRNRWLHKLNEFDAPLVMKLTKNFSKGTITLPSELPDNLLKAVVITCEQRARAKKKETLRQAQCDSPVCHPEPVEGSPNFIPFENQF